MNIAVCQSLRKQVLKKMINDKVNKFVIELQKENSFLCEYIYSLTYIEVIRCLNTIYRYKFITNSQIANE